MAVKNIKYEELEHHFVKPKDWSIYNSSHKYTGKIPRKLKKAIKTFIKYSQYKNYTFELSQQHWIFQGHFNPNYNRFLIKLITEAY